MEHQTETRSTTTRKHALKQFVKRIPFSIRIYFFLRGLMAIPGFLFDYIRFTSAQSKIFNKRFSARVTDLYPCLFDKTPTTPFDPHYVYHPAWAARILTKTRPKKHIDVASTLHFASIASAFVPIDFYDYRPAELSLTNLQSKSGNLLSLPFPDSSVESISCMHTIEHIGLGRYGDQIDPDGDLKAISELKRVTAPQGTIIFVTPVGVPRIEYNAHRIYSYEQVIAAFEGCELVEFSLIPDEWRKGIIHNAPPSLVQEQRYACGCFWFKKVQ